MGCLFKSAFEETKTQLILCLCMDFIDKQGLYQYIYIALPSMPHGNTPGI